MPRRPDRSRPALRQAGVDVPALLATLLLAAAVSSAVAVAMVRLTQPDPPRIASVRLTELTARFALDWAGDARSEEAAAAEARRWALALQHALRAVAERHRAVLLPARAVAEAHRTSRRRSRRRSPGRWRTLRREMRRRPPGAAVTARARNRVLVGMALFAGMWLLAASCVHVNASWSDGAWGYLALPILGEPELGDVVLFDPPENLGADVPYLKTVRAPSRRRVAVGLARTIVVDGRVLGTAKARAPRRSAAGGDRAGDGARRPLLPLGSARDSHDSRYAEVGFVPRGRIRARAVALPDIPWLGLEGPLVGPEGKAP